MPGVINNKKLFRFEIDLGESGPAYLDYRWKKGDMVLMRTFVPLAERGKGFGEQLVIAALEHAREKGLKVVIYCSFIEEFIKEHSEYTDLLAV